MGLELQKAINEASEWIEFDGVEGVGQGEKEGKDCIIVLVSCPPSELLNIIPTTFKGFPVVIKESGIISTQD
jgi:hypothetical protein